MNKIWCSFPMVTCPYCNQEFQVDDYYNMAVDDSFECLHCEKEIYILSLDTIMECELAQKPTDR
jgi:hypothetical protein